MSDVADSGSAAPVSDSADAADEIVEGQEGIESQDASVQAPKAPAAPTKNLKKFKYKADGQEYEDEIDLNDEKQIARHLSMSKAAYKRMEEAAKTRSQAESFIKMLQDDPIKVFTHPQFGGDKKFRELAEQFLTRQLQDEMMSPDEKVRRDNEERLRQYQDQEKQQKARQEEEQAQKLEEHFAQDFQAKIIQGLQSVNLPKSPKTVKRMAALMSKNLEHGLELPPEALAQIVQEEHLQEIKEMFGSTEGDVLLKVLGDDVANKIRKSDLARLRGTSQFPVPTSKVDGSVARPPEVPSNMSKDDWKAWIEKNSRA